MNSALYNVLLLNGPNLNLLGHREPHLYGHYTIENLEKDAIKKAQQHDISLLCHQSNDEAIMLKHLHHAIKEKIDGIIINAAGLTHTSVVLMDALLAFDGAIIEVHITNIYKRESFRQHSYIARAAHGMIAGLGTYGYLLAIEAIENIMKQTPSKQP